MIDRNRIAAAAFGMLAVGAAVAFPATAVADPPPDPLPAPADPAEPPPPPGPTMPILGQPTGPAGLNVLAQNGTPSAGPGSLGAPPVYGLDANSVLARLRSLAAGGRGDGSEPERVQQRLRRRGSQRSARRARQG